MSEGRVDDGRGPRSGSATGEEEVEGDKHHGALSVRNGVRAGNPGTRPR